jgi:outer membrane receptor protein involved in Fe transport
VNGGETSHGILLPKASLAWRAVPGLELYAGYGQGFHSNDVRGATIRIDPGSDEPAERVRLLVRGAGQELGARVETGRFNGTLALFWLTIGSELVFVGDAGATEPSPPSRRQGMEATGFWRPTTWLVLDGSASHPHARLRGLPPGERRIPGAVATVIGGGAAVELGSGFSGALRVRHFGAAPLTEGNSARSDATTLANLGVHYRWPAGRIAFDIFHLFGAREPDISYFYTSRLPGEPAGGAEDTHFHPVEPRRVRVALRFEL